MISSHYRLNILPNQMIADYISVGGNRQPHAADWNEDRQLVAFGANHCVAIWNPSNKISYTLKGHQKLVTCVKFVNLDTLLTGSEDATIRLWKFDNGLSRYKCHKVLEYHSKSITALAVDETGTVFITGSADRSIAFYEISGDGEIKIIGKKLVNERFYPLAVSIKLVNDRFVAAVGGTSNSVYIFSGCIAGGSAIKLDAKLEGHENWIRDVQFRSQHDDDNVLLATASQDRYIRLWKLQSGSVDVPGLERHSSLQGSGDDGESLLTNKVYHINEEKNSIIFEALIMGHDDWVFSISWHPSQLKLLSTSADSSANVWEPDPYSGIWISSARLGDISIKGASTATGASGGFWKGLWMYQGKSIATVGKTGSWRVWSLGMDGWYSQLGISGHFKPVTDVCWNDEGSYLLSTSLDQTTRLHAEWEKNHQWYEMARPQIHGYDMLTVKSLSNTLFVSGGDEKIFRVFEEPKGVAILLKKLTGMEYEDTKQLPESAIVPALGLSNKQQTDSSATLEEQKNDTDNNESKTHDNNDNNNNNNNRSNNNFKNDDYDNTTEENISSILSSLDEPPKEDHLQRLTLWPEYEKLYGHGYEVVSLDIAPDKSLLATCCKGNQQAHAAIRLFDVTTWKQLPEPLILHTLTVTRLRFSPDNNFLLSVSRDRAWGVFKRGSDGTFNLHASNLKGHSRIIWDCCWLSDSSAFVTGSRDKSFKLWLLQGDTYQCVKQISLEIPVTALDINEKGLLLVGTEDGGLRGYQLKDNDFTETFSIPEEDCPDQRIERICWRPNRSQFAVASADWSLRVYSL